MGMKKGPFIFLGILIITLFFILGIQFGKRVQTADEALKLLLTIAPSPSINPSRTSPSISFLKLDSKTCGFSFLYPSNLSTKKTSSLSGQLIDEGKQTVISFNCNNIIESLPEATSSVTLNEMKGIEYVNNGSIIIHVDNPVKDNTITLSFPSDYKELIIRTFQFQK